MSHKKGIFTNYLDKNKKPYFYAVLSENMFKRPEKEAKISDIKRTDTFIALNAAFKTVSYYFHEFQISRVLNFAIF